MRHPGDPGAPAAVRGVYLAPTPAYWGLVPPPTHVEGPQPEWFSWELGRFCELALKANPNLLEVVHVMHLLLSAEQLLATGVPLVDVGAHRDRLLAVRRGEVPWADVEAWRLDLHRRVDDAAATSPLPEAPDVARVDAWLRSVRARSAREALGGNG